MTRDIKVNNTDCATASCYGLITSSWGLIESMKTVIMSRQAKLPNKNTVQKWINLSQISNVLVHFKMLYLVIQH